MKTKNMDLQQELVCKNDKAYAYIGALNDYQEINGCEYFRDLVAEAKELNSKKVDLEEQIAELEKELLLNKKEQLELESNGYCPIDTTAYRLDGALTQPYLTHRKDCKHKEA